MKTEAPVVVIEVKTPHDQVTVGPRDEFGCQRMQLGFPRRDGDVDLDLENLVVVGQVKRAVVFRGFAADAQGQQTALCIGMELETLGVEVLDQRVKRRAELGRRKKVFVGHRRNIRPAALP